MDKEGRYPDNYLARGYPGEGKATLAPDYIQRRRCHSSVIAGSPASSLAGKSEGILSTVKPAVYLKTQQRR
jgi:hypothetical protein